MNSKWTPAKFGRIRDQLSLSQEAMAHLLDVSFQTINRWENGRAKPKGIWIEAYTLLAKTLELGVSSESIVGLSSRTVGRLRFFAELRQMYLETDAKENG